MAQGTNAAFGAAVHVSGTDRKALEATIAPWRKPPWRWREVETGRAPVLTGDDSPYRAGGSVPTHLGDAPRMIQFAAYTCFLFGQMFVPGLLMHTDLPETAAAMAPRRVTLAGAMNAAGKRLEAAQVAQLYATANVQVLPEPTWNAGALAGVAG